MNARKRKWLKYLSEIGQAKVRNNARLKRFLKDATPGSVIVIHCTGRYTFKTQ